MINKIGIKNYKAFKDASIELKPITILLGANSVGKSSIIKLLLLISQNVNSSLKNDIPLLINGEIIQFGSFENILHYKNTQNTLEINFSIENTNFGIYCTDLYRTIFRIVQNLKKTHYLCTNGLQKYQDYFAILDTEKEDRDIELLFKELISYKTKINNILKKEYKKDEMDELINRFIQIYFSEEDYDNSYFKNKDGLLFFDTKVLRDTYSFLKKLSTHKDSLEIIYKFKLPNNKKNIEIHEFSLISKDEFLFSYKKESSKHKIESIYLDENTAKSYASKFAKLVNLNQFQVYKRLNEKDNLFVDTMSRIIHSLLKEIKFSFNYESINYVDPLRAYPRRYYFLDEIKHSSALNKIDGETMAKILKDDINLKKKVNKWINKFKLNVNIEQIKETIHNIKIKQNNLSLDITDVGFGISQVLPIITQGFFANKNSTTIIEQPEIHLHPKMQADLADLFIEMVDTKNKSNKRFLIETHSEYMLKRLRRRIAEGQINSDDVAIYSLSLDKNTNCSEIDKIEIASNGSFEWPKDFHDTELEDTIQFLKHQG